MCDSICVESASSDRESPGTYLQCNFNTCFSGGCLERGFRRVIRDAPMGSLLVQSDAATGEPMCLQVMLPQYIRYRHMAGNTWVFLLDVQVSSCY